MQDGRNGNLSYLTSYTVNPATTFSLFKKPGQNKLKGIMKINFVC